MALRSVPTVDHWAEVEIDFGPVGDTLLEVVVSDAGVTATSRIIVTQSMNQPTGKDQDETTMDILTFKAWPGAGQFTLNVESITGPVHDKMKVFYNYA